jgi:muramoyltetrapeptide carboxypeptidase
MCKKIGLLSILMVLFWSCKDEYTYVTNVTEKVYTNNYYLENQMDPITEDIRPDFLKEGDSVAVFAISNSVSESDLKNGISVLESWGLKVLRSDNLYKVDGRYAGTQSERIEGLQKLVDNPNLKALIAARGGYGASQVIPYIDFSNFEKNPKWVVGFSDVTSFHAALNNKGIETIHGPMVNAMTHAESVKSLRDALFGDLKKHTFTTNKHCVEGEAEGRLVGGNLSIIYSLGGTFFDLNVRDAILLIEDVGESNYHIERMMINLKLSGKLECVKGVIVGDFTRTTQGVDDSIEEIMERELSPLGIPVLYGANFGHDTKNLATYLGRKVKLEVGSDKSTVTFQ